MVNYTDQYDHPWKEAIGLYFPPFLSFFFPHIWEEINWERGYEFLDKELQKIVRNASVGNRQTDKLVKVWRNNGEETWVLIHIEVQSQSQAEFAQRMYLYNTLIFQRYGQPVVSLAILADDQPRWRPQNYSRELWGCRVGLEFPIAKLLDYQTEMASLRTSLNPFAVIVEAHLATQQTRNQFSRRYQEKVRIVKNLYRRGYSREDILELFRLIDWILRLPQDLEVAFEQEIEQFEEETRMSYMTSWERRGREKGIQEGRKEGREEGIQEGIQEILESRFGEVEEEVINSVKEINEISRLKMLLRQATTVNSLQEFQSLLGS
ncbi:UNVERIFIED_CONTAM: transposase [Euhalothece sp. KZN 001]